MSKTPIVAKNATMIPTCGRRKKKHITNDGGTSPPKNASIVLLVSQKTKLGSATRTRIEVTKNQDKLFDMI